MAEDVLEHPLGERFDKALVYACDVHRAQPRKGTQIPYIAHPLAVAALVLDDGGSEEEAIAALLHDTLEDGQDTREEMAYSIAENFGADVVAIVEGCSEKKAPGEHGSENWFQRKHDSIAMLADESPSVHRVSLADKVHNARAILRDYRTQGEAVWSRFNAGREDQLNYYRSLADEFIRLKPGPLAEELDRIVIEIEQLASAN